MGYGTVRIDAFHCWGELDGIMVHDLIYPYAATPIRRTRIPGSE